MSEFLSHEEALELEEEIALENKNNETLYPTKLTPDQTALIERNRQKALLLKQARVASHPYTIEKAPRLHTFSLIESCNP